MHNTIKILSTKKLTKSQLKLFGVIEIVSLDFINIKYADEVVIADPNISRAIFTSKNAVKSCLTNNIINLNNIDEVYCVGDKTEQLLLDNNISVNLKSTSSAELAEQILKLDNKQAITYFCGNLTREELPEIITSNKISLEIVQVYETTLKPKQIIDYYNGILFFSPSAVASFIKFNSAVDSVAFCIGNSTAIEANKYFENVVVSKVPLIENVINLAVQYFYYE